jgi:hypothetical protein
VEVRARKDVDKGGGEAQRRDGKTRLCRVPAVELEFRVVQAGVALLPTPASQRVFEKQKRGNPQAVFRD